MIHYVSWPEWIAFLLGTIVASQPTRRSFFAHVGGHFHLLDLRLDWSPTLPGSGRNPVHAALVEIRQKVEDGRVCVIFPVPEPLRLSGPHPVGSLQVDLPATTSVISL